MRPARLGPSPKSLADQRVDELRGDEGLQVVHALADADEADGIGCSLAMAATTPPFARAVELGQHETGERRARRRTPAPARARSGRCWRRARAASRAAPSGRPCGSRAAPCGSPPSGGAGSAAARRCRRARRRSRAPSRRRSRRTSRPPGRRRPARSPRRRCARPRRRAARARPRGTCRRRRAAPSSPCAWKIFASLPIEVVLPAPLTPASMITNGRAAPTTSGFSSGARRSTSAALSSAFGSPSPPARFQRAARSDDQRLRRGDADVGVMSAVSSSSSVSSSSVRRATRRRARRQLLARAREARLEPLAPRLAGLGARRA